MLFIKLFDEKESNDIRNEICYSTILGIKSADGFYCRNIICEDYLLAYVTKGKFFVEQNGSSFVLGEDEYLLLNKRIEHTYYFDKSLPSELYWMHIRGGAVDVLAEHINLLSPLPVVGRNIEIYKAIKLGLELCKEHTDENFLAHSVNILRAIHCVLKDVWDKKAEERYPPQEIAFRESFEATVQSYAPGKLTLNGICERMHISKYYFCHKFREYYGISPMKYINKLKLDKAKHLLKYSNMKIYAIAEECGFSSCAYFCAVFGKECGMTPDEYRRI